MLDAADKLARGDGTGRPPAAELRRSISTSYYAAFHALTVRVAQFAVPDVRPPEQGVLCRAVSHQAAVKSAQTIFTGGAAAGPHKILAVQNLGLRAAASSSVVKAADQFSSLQDQRHDADYNHDKQVSRAEALAAVEAARTVVKVCKSTSKKIRPAMDCWCAMVLLLC